jgi:hypothetical protein
MRQRPSLFNYGTEAVAENTNLLCKRVDVAADVRNFDNPIVTVMDPLPVFGTNMVMDWAAQITELALDFHPNNVVDLPRELRPLEQQQFALVGEVCGGLAKHPKELLDRMQFLPLKQREELLRLDVRARDDLLLHRPTSGRITSARLGSDRFRRIDRPLADDLLRLPVPPFRLPVESLECFCLKLFAVGHFEVTGTGDNQHLEGKVDGVELQDITPKGLENSLESYMEALLRYRILPATKVALSKFTFDLLDGMASISLSATPTSANVPHNPAIEQNQLKVRIDMEVTS